MSNPVKLSTSVDNLSFTSIPYSSSTNTNQHHTINLNSDANDRIDTADTDSLLQTNSADGQQQSNRWALPIPYVSQYTVYFDFDTDVILRRLLNAAKPLAMQPFYVLTDDTAAAVIHDETLQNNKIDLYNPYWIVTTLIVVLSITGNLSNYLASTANGVAWAYDFSILSFCATVMYMYMFVVPVILYVTMKRVADVSEISIIQIMSLLGYSLLYLLPTAVVLCLHISALRWAMLACVWVQSSVFLVRNIWLHNEAQKTNTKMAPVAFGIVVLQAVLVLGIKLQCFTDTF